MKLDSRIKALSDVLTCFDTERASQFIGQKGYFADFISLYNCLADREYDVLTELDDDGQPFKSSSVHWRFFLPESCLKPKEKKFRPYTPVEFEDRFTIGRPIRFRRKGEVGCERLLILNGYSHRRINGETITYIYIGPNPYTLDELFNEYEWQEHYTEDFEPFGVEE